MRSLADEPIVRLILDGTVVRVRLDKKATTICLLVVLGVRADGQKMLLAVKNMGGETAQAWRVVLDDLIKRGLHPSTVTALGDYLLRGDRPRQPPKMLALFLSPAGTRLLYCNVQNTFQRLVRHCGIAPRSAACRPRLHDVRHAFAVNTILDAYRDDGDPAARLAVLSTYLGHINPSHTYWYLSAAPELLKLASDRLERHLGGDA